MPVNTSANAAIAALTTSSSTLTLLLKGEVVETGKYVPRLQTQSPPELKFNGEQGKTYLAVMLDTEAPFPAFNILSPILHWIQPGLVAAEDKLVSKDAVLCDYVAARPPPGSGPHQYVVFLYEQPAGFDAKKLQPEGQKMGMTKRIRFDLDAFEKEAGLGAIIACNYFKSN